MLRVGKTPEGMTVAEVNAYINYMVKQHPDVKSGVLDIELSGEDNVDLTLTPDIVRFQRVRRITGYLVGTVDRWNSAKQSELNDRVKHAKV